MTQKAPNRPSAGPGPRLHFAVLSLGACALSGFNALLLWGVLEGARAESARLESIGRMLEAGVSTAGVTDWLGATSTLNRTDAFFALAALVGSLAIIFLMAAATRALRREARFARESRHMRHARNLCAHMRDLAMDQAGKPLAIIDPKGRAVIKNKAFEALDPGLIAALSEKFVMPPVPPKRSGPQKGEDRFEPPLRAPEREESTLIWTSPSGEGCRLYIHRWFIGRDRTFSLVAIDDPWKPGGFGAVPAADQAHRAAPKERLEADIDANEALAGALDGLAPLIDETRADIRAHVLPMVRTVPEDLESLFRTLVETALYGEGAGRLPRIDIGATVDNGVAQITVEDNGAGTQSWGLPEILYGRSLSVETTPGEGSKVSFSVPAAKPDKPGLKALRDDL